MQYQFRVTDIPMVSFNKVYQGIHWSQRKGYKDVWREAFRGWHFLEKSPGVLDSQKPVRFEGPVYISYLFEQKYPMDSSNLAFMVKLIEDSLVEDQVIVGDDFKWVLSTTMIPVKAKVDAVTVFITDEKYPTYSELLALVPNGNK